MKLKTKYNLYKKQYDDLSKTYKSSSREIENNISKYEKGDYKNKTLLIGKEVKKLNKLKDDLKT